MKNNYFHIRFDEFLYKDETFIYIKYDGLYLSIPNKVVESYSIDTYNMIVHEKIFTDIVNKSSESHNNFCQLYF